MVHILKNVIQHLLHIIENMQLSDRTSYKYNPEEMSRHALLNKSIKCEKS